MDDGSIIKIIKFKITHRRRAILYTLYVAMYDVELRAWTILEDIQISLILNFVYSLDKSRVVKFACFALKFVMVSGMSELARRCLSHNTRQV